MNATKKRRMADGFFRGCSRRSSSQCESFDRAGLGARNHAMSLAQSVSEVRHPVVGFFNLRPGMRRALRVFALFSTVLGFYSFFNLHEYAPFHRRLFDGIFWTSTIHTGLWLSTIEVRGWLRYLVAVLLVPSAIGVAFLMWSFHDLFALGVLLLHFWLIAVVIKRDHSA
jgi:hypothetical protein